MIPLKMEAFRFCVLLVEPKYVFNEDDIQARKIQQVPTRHAGASCTTYVRLLLRRSR
jgi:hypothetical protein